jgi:hypothetical protein
MIKQLNLKIVPTEKVILHEHVDPLRVKTLMETLRERAVLKNPIVVTEADGDYVVLDGATRSTALKTMKIPSALVQVVDYTSADIQLHNWHHAIIGMTTNQLLTKIGEVEGLKSSQSNMDELKKKIDLRIILFGFVTPDGSRISYSSDEDHQTQMKQLNHIVDGYVGKAEFLRTIEMDPLLLRSQLPDLSAIFLFPRFSPKDIIMSAKNNSKIPAGISRHLVNGRALGVNVPLEILSNAESHSEKNEWLDKFLNTRFRKKMVRTYEETTVVFDD